MVTGHAGGTGEFSLGKEAWIALRKRARKREKKRRGRGKGREKAGRKAKRGRQESG